MPTSERVDPAPRALVWLAILILYVVWGSTYLGIRVAVESPLELASSRTSVTLPAIVIPV